MGSKRQLFPNGANGLSRREWMVATGGTGLTLALAGCMGGDPETGDDEDDGDDEDETGPEDTARIDQSWNAPSYTVPVDLQFNEFNPTNQPTSWDVSTMPFAFFSLYSPTHEEFVPLLFRDWEAADDYETITFHLNEEFGWDDGEPVDADDVRVYLELQRYMETELGGFYDGVSVEDEYTIRVEMSEVVDPMVFYARFFGDMFRMDTPESVFGEFVERFDEAEGEEEREGIQVELAEFQWDHEDLVSSGPFSLESIDQQRMIFEPNDHYPIDAIQTEIEERLGEDLSDWPAEPNFADAVRTHTDGHDGREREIIAGDFGAGTGVSSSSVADQFPDSVDYFLLPHMGGLGVQFNMHGTPFEQVEVRQAIAHIADRGSMSEQFYEGAGEPIERPTGLARAQEEQWFDDAFFESLEPYEQDFDRAAELLEEAGFSDEDGTWLTSDGEIWEPEVAISSEITEQLNAMQVLVSNLQNFGIEASLQTYDSTTFFGDIAPNYEWDMTRGVVLPYRAHHYFAATNGWFSPGDYLPSETVEVPPVGDRDGETESIDLAEFREELTRPHDEETTRELVQQFAWTFNQTMFAIPCGEGGYGFYVDRDRWRVPESDDPLGDVIPGTYFYPHAGLFQAQE